MATIQEVRQKYPDYQDLSDTQLADALYEKYYSDMDKGKFYVSVGLSVDNPQTDTSIPLMSVPGNALTSAPGDAWKVAKSYVEPFLHPLDTLDSMGAMIEGGLGTSAPANKQRDVDTLQQVKQMLADKYGGYENLKRTLSNEPIGALADLSTVLTGGGGLMARGPGMVGRVGNAVKAAGAATEPLSLMGRALPPIGKAVGVVGGGTTGFTTGAGKESVLKAYQSGRQGVSEFADAMRGNVTGDELRATAKSSLQAIKDDRAADYQARLASVTGNSTILDAKPVRDRVVQLKKMYNIKDNPDGTLDFSRSTLDRNAVGDVEHIIGTVDSWGTQAGDLTPVGMDILKRKLDDFYSESKNSRGFVTSLKNVVKDTIVKQVPEYGTMMENYAKSTSQINEIEGALSLGTRSGADTGIRKLLTALKDNNEFRGSLIKVLDEANNGELAAKIAGYNLSSFTPTNFIGKGMEVGAITSIFAGVSPKIAIALSMASPRLVGEFAYKLGGVVKQYEKMGKVFTPGIRNSLFQAGRVNAMQGPTPLQ